MINYTALICHNDWLLLHLLSKDLFRGEIRGRFGTTILRSRFLLLLLDKKSLERILLFDHLQFLRYSFIGLLRLLRAGWVILQLIVARCGVLPHRLAMVIGGRMASWWRLMEILQLVRITIVVLSGGRLWRSLRSEVSLSCRENRWWLVLSSLIFFEGIVEVFWVCLIFLCCRSLVQF